MAADEKSSFDALVESEDKHLSEVIRFKDEGSSEECAEVHVDFLGGKSNEKHDDLRKQMSAEGGTISVRFHEAAAAACQFDTTPTSASATRSCTTLVRTRASIAHTPGRAMSG